jgi:glycine/D-amino acid oxidase-like deaminating enzyme/nitrite reductase/ring-hydroxylating ferredoxin subunit
MNADGEATRSLWVKSAALTAAPPLSQDTQCDVAIVGAGIAGLSTAYELARAGQAVAVIDRGALAGGMTARTTAHLSSALDDYYHELIRVHGAEAASLYRKGQTAAIDRIAAIVAEEEIACGFRRIPGYLFAGDEDGADIIDREFDACFQIGFPVERLSEAPVAGKLRGPALRFNDQGRFHVLNYIAGLIEALRRHGARLYGTTAVTGVSEDEKGVVIETERQFKIAAAHAVVATNAPINDRLAVHSKQAPYRTYVLAFEVPAGAVADALIWDTLFPYHYVRLQELDPGRMALIVGGEDHKTGGAFNYEQRFQALSRWARLRFPAVGGEIARWSGQVIEPADFLPFSGRNPGNRKIFVHSGDSGQGMTNGVMGAMLISDLILGRRNELEALCDPSRKPLRTLGDLVAENLSVVRGLAERLAPGEVHSIDDVRPGEGALVRSGLTRHAVYREEGGALHEMSASCTHMGCMVHWNGLEKCWDCPCHGSHFAGTGTALNGPAISSLSPAETKATRV